MTKDHDISKPLELRTMRDYRNLSEIWKKEKENDKKAMERLEHLYGKSHPEKIKYNEEEQARRIKDAKREKLERLLGMYIAKGS